MYKYRLCRTRRYVECGFGILSNKWRIFQRPLNFSPDFEVVVIKAGVIPHNFVHERDGYKFEDALRVTGLENVPDGQSVRGGLTTNSIRNKVAVCFLTADRRQKYENQST
jgi:hypothetical protein